MDRFSGYPTIFLTLNISCIIIWVMPLRCSFKARKNVLYILIWLTDTNANYHMILEFKLENDIFSVVCNFEGNVTTKTSHFSSY